jgi:hypothetical protein
MEETKNNTDNENSKPTLYDIFCLGCGKREYTTDPNEKPSYCSACCREMDRELNEW